MARHIFCGGCSNKQIETARKYGELVDYKKGESTRNMECDHCAKKINEGDECCAVTTSRNTDTDWQNDYVVQRFYPS